jgi:hypothetical protein
MKEGDSVIRIAEELCEPDIMLRLHSGVRATVVDNAEALL